MTTELSRPHPSAQDAGQTPTNLRGIYTTDANGHYEIVTTRPVSYPVPTDGPVGPMLKAMERSEMRATHVHLLVAAPGHQTVVTHVFDSECQYLKTDAVFSLSLNFARIASICRSSTARSVIDELCGEAHAPSWLSRGRVWK